MSIFVRRLMILVPLSCASLSVIYAGFPDKPFVPAVHLNLKPQDKLAYRTKSTTYYPNLVFRVGLMSTDLTRLNDGVYANMDHQKFNFNIPFAGISYYFPLRIRKVGSFDVNIDYNYLLHQDLKVSNLQEAELWGFATGIGVGRDIFPTNRQFDLILSAGFQFGRLRYRYSNYVTLGNHDDVSSKNFFAPQLSLYPRWVFGYLVIGVRGSYHLDVLDQTWTGTSTSATVGAASATGWSIEGAIGIQLGIYR
jgi:hypothetical protein